MASSRLVDRYTHGFCLLGYLSVICHLNEFVDKVPTCFGACQMGPEDGTRCSWFNGYVESMY
jgi:hypothetical protein